jgi:tRNA(fMet)-specific endonuclease VapC
MTPPAHTGLLDTNVVIDLALMTEDLLPAFPFISAITLAELSAGPMVAKDPHSRATRQLILQQVEADFTPLPFDAACARRFGHVASELRRSGRTKNARAFDALIAATALAHNLPLFTQNPTDFVNIEGLEIYPVAIMKKG